MNTRKQKEREEKRQLILSAVRELIEEEGIESLSIRKIANKIDYSPAIIYHYFKDKEEIMEYFLSEVYKKIVSVLAGLQKQEGEPEEMLKSSLVNYIKLAVKMSDEYKAVMFSSSSTVLKHTSVLHKGASREKAAINMLCAYLKNNWYKDRDEDFIELTAQVIWSSVFGLISRLIIEKDIDEEQKQRLINYHVEFIINGLK